MITKGSASLGDPTAGFASNQECTLKKIQNYIFDFKQLLGQGNFSKVYKGHN